MLAGYRAHYYEEKSMAGEAPKARHMVVLQKSAEFINPLSFNGLQGFDVSRNRGRWFEVLAVTPTKVK